MKHHWKQPLCVLLCLLMVLTLLPISANAEIAGGTFGDNLTWTLQSDGILTISGSGPMPNYSGFMFTPWMEIYQEIKAVVFEPGVTSVGPYSFYLCSNITSVTLPDTVTSIGKNAFYKCTKLSDLILPETITIIEKNAFYNCPNLSIPKLPEALTSIGADAFYRCRFPREIFISKNLTNIALGAFAPISSRTAFYVDEENPKYASSSGNLLSKNGETLFHAHSNDNRYTIPDGIVHIADYAAFGNSFNEVIIPEGVTSIGDVAFASSDITFVKLPSSLKTIGSSAFYNTDIKDIYLPKGLTSIDSEAFMASDLTSVYLPDGLESIGSRTFSDIWQLDYVSFPASLEYIGADAFAETEVKSFYYRGSEKQWESVRGGSAIFGYEEDEYLGTLYPNCASPNCSHYISEYPFSAQISCFHKGVCVQCGALLQPTLNLDHPSLSFDEEIRYNFYFTVEDFYNVEEMGFITFDTKLEDGTVENATHVYPGYTAVKDNLYMCQTPGIPARYLDKPVYFKIYAKLSDGSYVYTDIAGYNAVAYAKSILNRSSNVKMKQLVISMMHYGAAAQEYFNAKDGITEYEPMNHFITLGQASLVSSYTPSMVSPLHSVDDSKTGMFPYADGDFTKRFSSVSFDGAFAINYYFTAKGTPDNGMKFYYWNLADYESAEALTPENATGSMDMELVEGNQYWGQVAGIAAQQIDETYFVAGVYELDGISYTTGILPYSIGAYCAKLAADTTDQQSLSAAVAVYGYYAKAYFTNA